MYGRIMPSLVGYHFSLKLPAWHPILATILSIMLLLFGTHPLLCHISRHNEGTSDLISQYTREGILHEKHLETYRSQTTHDVCWYELSHSYYTRNDTDVNLLVNPLSKCPIGTIATISLLFGVTDSLRGPRDVCSLSTFADHRFAYNECYP